MPDFYLIAIITILLITYYYHLLVSGQECPDDIIGTLPPHLIDKIVPRNYYLFITVDIHSGFFGGRVTVLFNYDPEADSNIESDVGNFIILHAHPQLRIIKRKTSVRRGGMELVINRQCRVKKNEFWVIKLKSPLSKGDQFIDLEFDGNVTNNELRGFYRVSYSDVADEINNNEDEESQALENKQFAITVFYRTNARKAFPCFDEPRFKTEFSIKIRHQEGYHALCHVEAVSTEKEKGWITTHFRTAGIKTSTFLVGWNINQFSSSIKKEDGVEFRVWSQRKFAKARTYSLSIAPKALKICEDFTGLPYPLGKLDLIAIPSTDFDSTAVEDWSLISIQEECLLWMGGESTIESKREVAATVVHEMTHQWFANRVSVKFWRHEWLNEGFATWLQYKGVDALEPNWNYDDERIIDVTHDAYFHDSKPDTRPIVPNVKWHEITNASHETTVSILYNKAASILFMIEGHMGERNFKKAVKRYLKEHNGGVVVTADLWKALQSVTKKEKLNVATFYSPWVTKPGFPVVKVSRNETHVTLTQQRFLRAGSVTSRDIWPIHVTFYLNGKKEYLTLTSETMTFSDISKEVRLKFNVEHQGFYITWYDDWSQFSSVVGGGYLKAKDYAGLITDINVLTSTEKVPYSEVIGPVGQILNATNNVVTWKQSATLIFAVDKFMKTSQTTRQILANRIQTWVERWYRSDMWIEKKKLVPQIRFAVVVIELACYFGHRRCLQDAKRHFDEWRHQNAKLTPNLRAMVWRFGVKESDDVNDLDFVWQKFTEAEDYPLAAKKTELKTALAFVRHENLVKRFLNTVWNDLTDPNFYDFMVYLANNPDAVKAAWDKFSSDFAKIRFKTRLTADKLGELVMEFSRQFATVEEMEKVSALFRRLFDERKANAKIRQAEIAIDRNKMKQQRHANAF